MAQAPDAPDNSAQKEAAKQQQADLEKKNKELQMKNEATSMQATADYNARRRGQTGRASLIATSEKGVALGGRSLLG